MEVYKKTLRLSAHAIVNIKIIVLFVCRCMDWQPQEARRGEEFSAAIPRAGPHAGTCVGR